MGNHGDDSDCPTIRDQSRLLRGNGSFDDVLGVEDVEVGVALFGELDRLVLGGADVHRYWVLDGLLIRASTGRGILFGTGVVQSEVGR